MLVTATSPMFVIVPVKPMTPPGSPLVAGQDLVIVKRGVVSTGQVAVALVATGCAHTSTPLAVTMSTIEHTLVGTGSVPLKLAPWPGSSRAIVVTGVLGAG